MSFFLICVAVLVGHAAVAADSPLSVVASGTTINGTPAIVFKITNTGSDPLKIEEVRLPWKNRYSATVALVDRKSSDTARTKFRIEDNFGSRLVELHPGQSIDGAISLERFVIDPRQFLKKNDVLIFWYYNPKDSEGRSLGEYGGWFAVPKAS